MINPVLSTCRGKRRDPASDYLVSFHYLIAIKEQFASLFRSMSDLRPVVDARTRSARRARSSQPAPNPDSWLASPSREYPLASITMAPIGPGAHFIPLRNPAFARACNESCQPGIWRPSHRCATTATAARWMSARLTTRREKRAVRASGQGKASQSAFGHERKDSRLSGPGSAVPSKSRGNSGVESTRPAGSGEAPVNGLASEGNSNSCKPVRAASDTGRILSGPALDPLGRRYRQGSNRTPWECPLRTAVARRLGVSIQGRTGPHPSDRI